MASPRRTGPAISRRVVHAAITGTVFLAAGAFSLSFASLTDLAVLAGLSPTLAWIWPLIVDGLIVVSTMAIVALAGHNRRVMYYPWTLLIGGALVSIAANSVHAILAANGVVPAAVSALVAAVPPIVLVAITHLSVILVQQASAPPARAKREARPGAASVPVVPEAVPQTHPHLAPVATPVEAVS